MTQSGRLGEGGRHKEDPGKKNEEFKD